MLASYVLFRRRSRTKSICRRIMPMRLSQRWLASQILASLVDAISPLLIFALSWVTFSTYFGLKEMD